MDKLPNVICIEIAEFLQVKEIFAVMRRVNMEWYRETGNKYFLKRLVKREIGLLFVPELGKEACLDLLKKLKVSFRNNLRFFGYATNGGISESYFKYSHCNLFSKNDSPYCTKENANNVDVCGVFAECVMSSEVSDELIQKCYEKNLGLISTGQDCDAFEVKALYKVLKANGKNPQIANQVRVWKKNFKSEWFDKMITSQQDGILTYNCDLSVCDQSEKYSAISSFCIKNSEDFTCPVKILMLFISESYIEISSHHLKKFNYLSTFKSVQCLAQVHQESLRISNYTLKKHIEYCEFAQINTNQIKPIAWVKLLSNSHHIILNQIFTGKYLYVKLISPKDKRKENFLQHTALNIDCESILPTGLILNLPKKKSNNLNI